MQTFGKIDQLSSKRTQPNPSHPVERLGSHAAPQPEGSAPSLKGEPNALYRFDLSVECLQLTHGQVDLAHGNHIVPGWAQAVFRHRAAWRASKASTEGAWRALVKTPKCSPSAKRTKRRLALRLPHKSCLCLINSSSL